MFFQFMVLFPVFFLGVSWFLLFVFSFRSLYGRGSERAMYFTPVRIWCDMARAAARVAGQQGLDNRQVFAGFFSEPPQIVQFLIVRVRHIAESTEQGFQPVQFVGQKRISATVGDQVVQAAVEALVLVRETEPPSGAKCRPGCAALPPSVRVRPVRSGRKPGGRPRTPAPGVPGTLRARPSSLPGERPRRDWARGR